MSVFHIEISVRMRVKSKNILSFIYSSSYSFIYLLYTEYFVRQVKDTDYMYHTDDL